MAADSLVPIVAQGQNCWRIARADKAAVIVDAADYYRIIAGVMEAAEKRIFIAGWDFDTRIALSPDEHGKGETLGRFFLRLAKEKPHRQIDILKWNFGAMKQLLHATSVVWLWRWERTKAIDFRFDRSHPVGCSHHQKIVVIDDRIAVCGGIDISARRWDTSDHLDEDPRRVEANGRLYPPWHDATMMMQGAVAEQLSTLVRERWKVSTHAELKKIEPYDQEWPVALEPMFENVDIAIARTRAAYDNLPDVREIETLYLDMIAAAKRFIYFENQYFTSGKIAAAIALRMAEADPPEIVMVMPRTADGWLEQKAMDAARLKLVAEIGKSDTQSRFRVYIPVTKNGTDIYVHAKVSILDDRLLRVGSSNLNNRSQRLDSECDVIIDAALPANRGSEAAMTVLRHRLIAEHLDIAPEEFAAREAAGGSMIDAIEALRGEGKTLKLLEMKELSEAQLLMAENEVLDPESADEMFEPFGKHGMAQSWAKGRAMIGRRLGRGGGGRAR